MTRHKTLITYTIAYSLTAVGRQPAHGGRARGQYSEQAAPGEPRPGNAVRTAGGGSQFGCGLSC